MKFFMAFSAILTTFFLVFLLTDHDKKNFVVSQFFMDEEKANENLEILKGVEYRLNNGPFIYEEVQQMGLELKDVTETKINNQKNIKVILKSNETQIIYEKVFVDVTLYNKNKQAIQTFRETVYNVQPLSENTLLFNINGYNTSYYKVNYETSGAIVK